ncbi:MAG: PIN domain-containing protein [Gracilimonas sp.]|nr:PIN domain-containing protein [Gracilimonas sp.]
MRIYLDNCSFNRPFDDQHQIRIRIEAEAKLYIQSLIDQGKPDLVWSYILEYENLANPYEFRQIVIQKWKRKSKVQINENKQIVKLAEELTDYALKAKDALHLACAIEAECEYFITTDDKILNKNNKINSIEIINPVDMLDILEV